MKIIIGCIPACLPDGGLNRELTSRVSHRKLFIRCVVTHLMFSLNSTLIKHVIFSE